MASGPLTVAVYAQLTPLAAGGTAQAVLELLDGLGKLTDGDERYLVVTSPEGADWLGRHIAPNQRLLTLPYHLSHAGPAWQAHLAGALNRRRSPLVLPLRRLWQTTVLPLRSRWPGALVPPRSDGLIESLGVDVIHFPYQRFIRSSIPTIFEPWDLQHRHLPQFFTGTERRERDAMYRVACERATAVVVASSWVRRDLWQHYAVPASKSFVIRRGPPPQAGSAPTSVAAARAELARFQLPEAFCFYPAQTWPHKNHLRLLQAVAQLRDKDAVRVNLVCAGRQTDYFATISRQVATLRLSEQVRFLGYVSPESLSALYRSSMFVLAPSLFEGFGFPVLEAFQSGVPVACSNVTALPEVAGDAAVLFDPTSVDAMAAALLRLWQSATLRRQLVARGRERLKLFSNEATARTFRALYRTLTRRPLSQQDDALLQSATEGSLPPSTSW